MIEFAYTFPCLLLSGMPCTGKDTISRQLTEIDPTFAFFRKHRAAPSSQAHQRDDTYISTSPEEFWRMVHADGFIQFHQRYERMYGVSKEEYQALINTRKIPIIHVGKYENLRVLREGGLQRGLSLLLWTDRNIACSRLIERHKHRSDGIEERIIAYDQEVEQLKHWGLIEKLDFDLVFVNNGIDPVAAVNTLLSLLRNHSAISKQQTQNQLSRLLGL